MNPAPIDLDMDFAPIEASWEAFLASQLEEVAA